MTEIKLPPLPSFAALGSYFTKECLESYARQAIELDRQGRGEPVAYLRKDHLQQIKQRGSMFGEISTQPRDDLVAVFTVPQPADQVVKESLTVAEPVNDLQRAVEAYQIAEQECAQRHSDAGNLIEPGIAVEAGLVAAAPFLAWQQPAEPVKAPSEPLGVFSEGDWAYKETGQTFSAKDLDAAAFAVYRDYYGQPAQHAVSAEPMLNCAIKPRPLDYPLSDYHRAMSDGPLNWAWKDKPHRIVYDLIAAVKHYAAPTPPAADHPQQEPK